MDFEIPEFRPSSMPRGALQPALIGCGSSAFCSKNLKGKDQNFELRRIKLHEEATKIEQAHCKSLEQHDRKLLERLNAELAEISVFIPLYPELPSDFNPLSLQSVPNWRSPVEEITDRVDRAGQTGRQRRREGGKKECESQSDKKQKIDLSKSLLKSDELIEEEMFRVETLENDGNSTCAVNIVNGLIENLNELLNGSEETEPVKKLTEEKSEPVKKIFTEKSEPVKDSNREELEPVKDSVKEKSEPVKDLITQESKSVRKSITQGSQLKKRKLDSPNSQLIIKSDKNNEQNDSMKNWAVFTLGYWHCTLCKIKTVNEEVLENHFNGKRHKLNLLNNKKLSTEKSGPVKDPIAQESGPVKDLIAEKSETNKNSITEKSEPFKELISEKSEPNNKLTTEKSEPVKDSRTEKPESVKDSVTEKSEPVKELTTEKSEPDKKLTTEKSELSKKLTTEKSELGKKLTTEKSELSKKLTTEKSELGKKLTTEKSELVEKLLTEKSEHCKDSITQQSEPVKEVITEKSEPVKNSITHESEPVYRSKPVKELIAVKSEPESEIHLNKKQKIDSTNSPLLIINKSEKSNEEKTTRISIYKEPDKISNKKRKSIQIHDSMKNYALFTKGYWHCTLCKIKNPSKKVLETHFYGKRHKSNLLNPKPANPKPLNPKPVKDLTEQDTSKLLNRSPNPKPLNPKPVKDLTEQDTSNLLNGSQNPKPDKNLDEFLTETEFLTRVGNVIQKLKTGYLCTVCNLPFVPLGNVKLHLKGKKHRKNVEKLESGSESRAIKEFVSEPFKKFGSEPVKKSRYEPIKIYGYVPAKHVESGTVKPYKPVTVKKFGSEPVKISGSGPVKKFGSEPVKLSGYGPVKYFESGPVKASKYGPVKQCNNMIRDPVEKMDPKPVKKESVCVLCEFRGCGEKDLADHFWRGHKDLAGYFLN